mmetsp:Transcript_96456/g.241882  ORF Transcript_96456/g.241882 Transcript_96456/m.241882 type:complete len:269 (-) Transcript_96456:526-1332(-)
MPVPPSRRADPAAVRAERQRRRGPGPHQFVLECAAEVLGLQRGSELGLPGDDVNGDAFLLGRIVRRPHRAHGWWLPGPALQCRRLAQRCRLQGYDAGAGGPPGGHQEEARRPRRRRRGRSGGAEGGREQGHRQRGALACARRDPPGHRAGPGPAHMQAKVHHRDRGRVHRAGHQAYVQGTRGFGDVCVQHSLGNYLGVGRGETYRLGTGLVHDRSLSDQQIGVQPARFGLRGPCQVGRRGRRRCGHRKLWSYIEIHCQGGGRRSGFRG